MSFSGNEMKIILLKCVLIAWLLVISGGKPKDGGTVVVGKIVKLCIMILTSKIFTTANFYLYNTDGQYIYIFSRNINVLQMLERVAESSTILVFHSVETT